MRERAAAYMAAVLPHIKSRNMGCFRLERENKNAGLEKRGDIWYNVGKDKSKLREAAGASYSDGTVKAGN